MRLQDIGCNAVSDPVSRLVEGTAGQMRVARGRLDVAVAEQLADGRQGLPRSSAREARECRKIMLLRSGRLGALCMPCSYATEMEAPTGYQRRC